MPAPRKRSSTGTQKIREVPSLKADLKVWAAEVQAKVDEGKARRSAGVEDAAAPVDVVFYKRKAEHRTR